MKCVRWVNFKAFEYGFEWIISLLYTLVDWQEIEFYSPAWCQNTRGWESGASAQILPTLNGSKYNAVTFIRSDERLKFWGVLSVFLIKEYTPNTCLEPFVDGWWVEGKALIGIVNHLQWHFECLASQNKSMSAEIDTSLNNTDERQRFTIFQVVVHIWSKISLYHLQMHFTKTIYSFISELYSEYIQINSRI